jgi:hypothetical protein
MVDGRVGWFINVLKVGCQRKGSMVGGQVNSLGIVLNVFEEKRRLSIINRVKIDG